MGTTVGWRGKSKAEVFADLFGKPWGGTPEAPAHWVDHPHFVASGVWARLNIREDDGRVRAVILHAGITRRGVEWAEKSSCETSGPCEVDCPLALLELVPAPTAADESENGAKWAAAWRESVRAHHAGRVAGRVKRAALKVGDVLTFPETWTPPRLTVAAILPRRILGRSDDGRPFRITPRAIAAASILTV